MILLFNLFDIQFILKFLILYENFIVLEVLFIYIEKSKIYLIKLVVFFDKIFIIILEGRNRFQIIFDLDFFGKITSDFEVIKFC